MPDQPFDRLTMLHRNLHNRGIVSTRNIESETNTMDNDITPDDEGSFSF
jgi:hypothetical protein